MYEKEVPCCAVSRIFFLLPLFRFRYSQYFIANTIEIRSEVFTALTVKNAVF
jgi:hypothetical protein